MTTEPDRYATYCPECDFIAGPDEEGFDYEECLECGSPDVYEVPW